MTLSLIVPTHRPSSLTKRSLLDLARVLSRAAPPESRIELLICVNGPESTRIGDELRAGLDEAAKARTRILALEQTGVNRARNEAARHADGRTLVFFDDDTILEEPSLLERIRGYADAQQGAWASGGRYRGLARSRAGRAYAHIQSEFQEGIEATGQRFFPGGFLVIARELFWNLEGFDEDIVWGGAELRLNERLNRAAAAHPRPSDWVLPHRIRVGWRGLVRKGLRQGQGSLRVPAFDGAPRARAPRELRFGVALYRGAFLVGRSERAAWIDFFMRFPGALILLCFVSRGFGSWYRVLDLRGVDERKFWRLCWILLRLRGLPWDRIEARLKDWHARANPAIHFFRGLMDTMGKEKD